MGTRHAMQVSFRGGGVGRGARRRLACGASRLALVLAGLLCSTPAAAQAVVNPQAVSFAPSPDHDATRSDGRAVVTSYEVEFYEVGAANALLVADLAKPDPDASGRVSVDFLYRLPSPPPTGMPLTARVVAVGPGGRGRSEPSTVFVFEACSVQVNPIAVPLSSAGGTVSVGVTTAAGCAWHARTDSSWMSITSGAAGYGTGVVVFGVAPNTTTQGRSAALWIGGWAVTVMQAPQQAAPVVRLTSPVNGTRYNAPVRIPLNVAFAAGVRTATASVARRDRTPADDRTINRVTFLVNGRPLGSVSMSPYRSTWTTATPGTFVVVAIAVDNAGRQWWSDPVSITIAGSPPETKPAKPRK